MAQPSEDLVNACIGSNNEAAWIEFVGRYRPVIAKVVLRTARRWTQPQAHLLDDLIQRFRVGEVVSFDRQDEALADDRADAEAEQETIRVTTREGGPGSRSIQGQGEAAADAPYTPVPAPTANSRPPMPRFDPSMGPIPPARFSIDA